MLPEWATNLMPWACATLAGAGVLALAWLWRRNADWTARADYAARTKGDAGLSLFRDDPEPTIHMTGCARCGGEPGDIGTVHYKGLCAVTHAIREVHWCCPDDCELTPPYPAAPTAEAVDEWTRRVMDLPTAEVPPVSLGRHVLHGECLGARRDGAYDLICASCRPSLVGSAKGLPR